MNSSLISAVDRQISCAQETLNISNNLKEKLIGLENEKNEALKKCKLLETKINRLKEEKCLNCAILLNKLNEEKAEKEKLKKEEKIKLLKSIVRTLESTEDGATNPMSNAQQLLTQLVFDGCDSSQGKKRVELIGDTSSSDEDSQNVFADETVIAIESEDSSNDCKQKMPVIVLETEMQGFQGGPVDFKKSNSKENRFLLDEECELQQIAKRPKCEQILSSVNGKTNVMSRLPPSCTNKNPEKALHNNQKGRSSPVLIAEANNEARPDEQSTKWKMKPSFLVDNTNDGATSGKRLKQMTLSLSRPEKKHDISLSEKFKGGLANNPIVITSDEEKDVVFPSPNRQQKKFFTKKHETAETLQDPDLTVFQPNAASTCHPVESSFDKLPEQIESPPYKYRRDTVRKKEKRMKLPGQDCDECAKYYKAAGLDKTQDVKTRMNACSRHRDKYMMRANTPPGFWDPVFPVTPEGSQEDS